MSDNVTEGGLPYEASITTIGPAEAKEILSYGHDYNRRPSEKHAQQLANKMTNGDWKFNGDPLRFDGHQLIDGQHRLMAIIKSNQSYPFVCVKKLDPAVFSTIDSGKKRDFATTLEIGGETHPKELASATRQYFNLTVGSSAVTIEDMKDQLEAHPELRELVEECITHRGTTPKGVSVGVIAATQLLAKKLDANLAEEFFRQLITGQHTTANTSLLRETIGEIGEEKGVDKKSFVNSAIRQAWNATRANKILERIKLTTVLPDLK